MLLLHYFPTGMLGLGLTALLASFMSGMAGNVTAFNTVWTYDIYQSLHQTNAERRALPVDGPRWRRWAASLLSVAAAYVASAFNNIMDMLQLVFAFVNAPLFAHVPARACSGSAPPATARSGAWLPARSRPRCCTTA